MSNLADVLRTHPLNQFKKSPRFYLRYDAFYVVLCAALTGLMIATGFQPVVGRPTWAWAVIAPVLLFALIWAHLTIHNCTHGNLPKSINRLVGELLGLMVVVRFSSWAIIHMRHHKYSDDRTKDPHPNFPSFVTTVKNTVLQVEKQLFAQYFEIWGDTPQNRTAERRRALVSYGANVLLVATWTLLLGPWFTLCVFAPMNALAGLFIIHFNWSTHNGERGQRDDDFKPVNLNHGYYWIGNKVFSGIYMHANHHDRPHLANPANWSVEKYGKMAALVTDQPMRNAA